MSRKLLARRGLSFDRLAALIDLSEAGSLVKAAGGDPNRQTLYSRQIRELEEFFGVELTRRRGNTLELTEAGRRLVEISRGTMLQLEDFQATCDQHPLTLTIGAGDSAFQWLLLPRLSELHRLFPRVGVELRDLSTVDVVRELGELRVDLGIIRESAVVEPLESVRLLRMTFSLFVPKALLPPGPRSDYRRLLGSLPLALQSTGGQFHTTFEEAARKHKIRCRAALRCLSFIQAHRALLTGQYAAILPSFAAGEVDPARFVQIPLPMLRSYERILSLAWNPRMIRLRPEFEKIRGHLARTLAKD